MELECQNCGNEWDYQGESDYYATCPNCHYKVKIPAKAEVVAPEKELKHDVAVLGGTGDMGAGVVKRLAAAGYDVVVGSRKYGKAQRLTEEYTEDLQEAGFEDFDLGGMKNPDAAEESEIVIVTIPYKYAGSTVESLDLKDKIVVSTLVPMKKEGNFFKYEQPDEGSAAEELQSKCEGTVVSALQNVPAKVLNDLEKDLFCDVVVCSDDEEAKQKVMNLIDDISGLRALNGGPLSMSSAIESETPKLLNLARENPMKHVRVVYEGDKPFERNSPTQGE